jgi:hypothetical protein
MESAGTGTVHQIAAGTNYTLGLNGWGGTPYYYRTESQRVTSLSAIAATFTDATNGANGNFWSGCVVYTEGVPGFPVFPIV